MESNWFEWIEHIRDSLQAKLNPQPIDPQIYPLD